MNKNNQGMMDVNIHKQIVHSLSDVVPEYWYILNYKKGDFHYVANHYIEQWGWQVSDFTQLGLNYPQESTYPEDYPLFIKIRKLLLDKINDMGDKVEQVMYFSFHYRIKSPHKILNHFMVHLKMTPVIVNGEPVYAVVSVASSIVNTPGHLRVYFKSNEGSTFEECNLDTGKWKAGSLPRLNLQEQQILILTRTGCDVKCISARLHLSPSTIRNIMTKMYRKLNVNSITQAVLYAWDHRMLYTQAENRPAKKAKATNTRFKMTPEILEQVQEDWNRGMSINSIAKDYSVAEGSIRYAIRKGKLTIPPHLQTQDEKQENDEETENQANNEEKENQDLSQETEI